MDALLARLCDALPAPVQRRLTPHRLTRLAQMLRFGLVGTAGFLVDTATVYACRHAVGLYRAGMISYVVAATATWYGNRRWTFRPSGPGRTARSPLWQWVLFVGTNLIGFCLNRGMYFALISLVAACRQYPVAAIAAGALAGMSLNYTMSRRVVFR